MSLLDQASLVITPNGYKEGILYSVIPNTTLGDMDVIRATTATRVNELGFIEEVGINVPRIDYTNGSCPSILVEPQRTNLLTYSNDFANSVYYLQDSTITTNFAISPDGTQNANKITVTATDPVILQNVYSGLGTTYTMSIYAKGVGSTIGKTCTFFIIRDAFLEIQTFDFQLTSEWKRFTATFTLTAVPLTNVSYRVDLPNSSVVVGDQVLIYGAQLEQGSYATSYIPTTSASVTRNADVISKTGISSLIGQTEGTIFSNFYYSGNALGSLQIYPLYIGQGTFTDSVTIGLFENALLCRVFTDGVAQNYFTSSPLSIGNHKVAFVYANNNLKLFLNGVLIATDASATIPNCSQVYIGSSGTTTMPEKININNNLIFKTVLTDQECINLTTL
jgi:hypothetical protein